MDLQVHFPDLTEVGRLYTRSIPGKVYDYTKVYTYEEVLAGVDEKIKTELAFLTQNADYSSLKPEVLKAAGWYTLRKGKNWHRHHNGDNTIEIWMKRFPQNKGNAVAANRHKVWITPGFNVGKKNCVFAFGCGGRLVDGFKLNALRRCNIRPLTILRVSKTNFLKQLQLDWLRAARFIEFSATEFATYYVNGFEPASYKEDFELAFWEGWESKTKISGLRRKERDEED